MSFWEGERVHMAGRGAAREGQRVPQAGCTQCRAQLPNLRAGPDPPKAGVGGPAQWATEAPLRSYFLNPGLGMNTEAATGQLDANCCPPAASEAKLADPAAGRGLGLRRAAERAPGQSNERQAPRALPAQRRPRCCRDCRSRPPSPGPRSGHRSPSSSRSLRPG